MLDNELNDNELIEILESSEEPVTFEALDEVHEFILAFNIKEVEEDTHIKADSIYNLYKKWRGQSKHVLSKTAFFMKFSKHFTSKRVQRYRYYSLDPEPFDLNNEESVYKLEQAMKNRRKRNKHGEEIY